MLTVLLDGSSFRSVFGGRAGVAQTTSADIGYHSVVYPMKIWIDELWSRYGRVDLFDGWRAIRVGCIPQPR